MKTTCSKLLTAAIALSGKSSEYLAMEAGLSPSQLSQLRSGKRGNTNEALRIFSLCGMNAKALIKKIALKKKGIGNIPEDSLITLLCLSQHIPEYMGSGKADICCDGIAITIDGISPKGQELISHAMLNGQPVDGGQHYKNALRYKGVFIGNGLRWKSFLGVRLQFNPSKVHPSAFRFVSRIIAEAVDCEPFVSRLDIAVDLAVQIGTFQVLGSRTLKSTAIYSTKLETIYLGSPKSPCSFAIYDKALELVESKKRYPYLDHGAAGLPHPKKPSSAVTRVESRLRKFGRLPLQSIGDIANPFTDLRLLWLGDPSLPFEVRILFSFARWFGFDRLRRELSKERFKEIRSLATSSKAAGRFVHPRDVFDERWQDEARSLLKKLNLTVK